MWSNRIEIEGILDCISSHLNKPKDEVVLQDIANIAKEEYTLQKTSSTLDQVVSIVLREIRNTKCTTQIEILELTEAFGFQRQEETIRLFQDALEFPGEDVTLPSFDNQPYIISHKTVINSIAWHLFSYARYTNLNEQRVSVFNLFLELLVREDRKSERYFDESKSASVLLNRLFFSESWSELYNDLLIAKLTDFCTSITKNQSLSPSELKAFRIMYSGMLDCEKRISSWKDETTLQMTQFYVTPTSDYWSIISRFLQFGKSYLFQTSNPNSLIIDIIIYAYAEMITSLNRSALPETSEKMAIQRNAIDSFFVTEFTWLKQLLQSHALNDTQQNVIRESWKWHLEFSSNKQLKVLANECEEMYFGSEELEYYKGLYDYSGPDKKKQSEDYFFDKLRKAARPSDIQQFVDRAEKYGSYSHSNYYAYCNILWRIGNEAEDIHAVRGFVENGLKSKSFFGVAMTCLNGMFKQLRDKKDFATLESELAHFLGVSETPQAYLLGLYQSIHRENIGLLTDIDIKFLQSNLAKLDNKVKGVLFSSFCLPYWGQITHSVDANWDSCDPETQAITIGNIVEKISMFHEIYSFVLDELKMDWIVKKTFSLKDIDLLRNFDYTYKQLLKLCPQRYSLDWFYEWICPRFDAAKVRGDIKIFPKYFDITCFFKIDLQGALEKDTIGKILDKYLEEWYGYYRSGDILTTIDPNGEVIGQIVAEKIELNNDFDVFLRLAAIAGYYNDTSSGWDQISLSACKKACGLDDEKKQRIFCELMWKGIRSYSSAYNEVSKKYYEELEEARKRLETSDEYRKAYWELQVKIAESAIAREKEMLVARTSGGSK